MRLGKDAQFSIATVVAMAILLPLVIALDQGFGRYTFVAAAGGCIGSGLGLAVTYVLRDRWWMGDIWELDPRRQN